MGNRPLGFTDSSGLQDNHGDGAPYGSGDCDFFCNIANFFEDIPDLFGGGTHLSTQQVKFNHTGLIPRIDDDGNINYGPGGPDGTDGLGSGGFSTSGFIFGDPVHTNPNCVTNLPLGSNPAFCAPFQQGFDMAQKLLRKQKCSKYYGGQGAQTLNATQYRFVPMSPTVGAATNPDNSVFINSAGPYMNGAPDQFLHVFWSLPLFRGFILLHELGHQLSSITGFLPDANNIPLNQAQSTLVIQNCIF